METGSRPGPTVRSKGEHQSTEARPEPALRRAAQPLVPCFERGVEASSEEEAWRQLEQRIPGLGRGS